MRDDDLFDLFRQKPSETFEGNFVKNVCRFKKAVESLPICRGVKNYPITIS
jgi:hypothetical protein